MKSGIYVIRNTANGKVYVGSAVNIKGRWAVHKHGLRRGKHHSQRLQRAWNKYGEAAFVLETLELCCVDLLLEREQSYFDIACRRIEEAQKQVSLFPADEPRQAVQESLL